MKQQFYNIIEYPCGLVVKCKCIFLYQLQYCNIVCVLDYTSKPLLYKVLMAINVSVHHNGGFLPGIMYYVVWSHIL